MISRLGFCIVLGMVALAGSASPSLAREPEVPCFVCSGWTAPPYTIPNRCVVLSWEVGSLQFGQFGCTQTWQAGQIIDCELSGGTCWTGIIVLDGSLGGIQYRGDHLLALSSACGDAVEVAETMSVADLQSVVL